MSTWEEDQGHELWDIEHKPIMTRHYVISTPFLDWKSKRTSVKERVEQMGGLQIAFVWVKIYMAMVIDNQFVIFL